METKACTKCGVEKPRTKEYFVLDGRRSDGLGSKCRKCANSENVGWRKKNPEYSKKYLRKYYKTLRGHISKLVGAIKNRCTHPSQSRYKYYGGRGIKCGFTSNELYNWLITNNIDPRGLQIHRIDNNENYTLGNIEFLNISAHTKLHWSQKQLNIKGDK